MERKDRTYMRETYSYVDGNTVRKMEVAEELERLPERNVPDPQREAQRNERREKARRRQGMDLFTVLFLTVALCLTGAVCVQFLKAKSDVTNLKNELATLQSEIVTMKEENKNAQEDVTSDIDLSYIYKEATGRLGMVHPDKDQVITYESSQNDSVQQYGDIPSDTDSGLREKILGEQ